MLRVPPQRGFLLVCEGHRGLPFQCWGCLWHCVLDRFSMFIEHQLLVPFHWNVFVAPDHLLLLARRLVLLPFLLVVVVVVLLIAAVLVGNVEAAFTVLASHLATTTTSSMSIGRCKCRRLSLLGGFLQPSRHLGSRPCCCSPSSCCCCCLVVVGWERQRRACCSKARPSTNFLPHLEQERLRPVIGFKDCRCCSSDCPGGSERPQMAHASVPSGSLSSSWAAPIMPRRGSRLLPPCAASWCCRKASWLVKTLPQSAQRSCG
mmetsp:Transcript_4396/g.10419  ORF Transcript_4396/g.10419 Transcript_4396/m.10419 type:complete len:261 (-) Transcript_4396:400-1182(-)